MQILHGSLIYGIKNKVEFKEMLIWKKRKSRWPLYRTVEIFSILRVWGREQGVQATK